MMQRHDKNQETQTQKKAYVLVSRYLPTIIPFPVNFLLAIMLTGIFPYCVKINLTLSSYLGTLTNARTL